MSAVNFIRLMMRHWKILVFLPLLSAIMVFIALSFSQKEYRASLRMYTGLGSDYNLMSTSILQQANFFSVNTAFDNLINTIKSDAVLQSVGLSLFAHDMIYGGDGSEYNLSAEQYDKLIKSVPLDVQNLIDTSSVNITAKNLEEYMSQNTSNFVYKLIHLKDPHYSIEALHEIKVRKIGSSDLLEISYTNDNAAICYNTLLLLSTNFIDIYQNLHSSENSNIVNYFKSQLTKYSNLLKETENKFTEFAIDNRIINYAEQSKSLSNQLQSLNLEHMKMLTQNIQAKKKIDYLEQEIGLKYKLKGDSDLLLNKRNEISSRMTDIITANVFTDDSTYLHLDVNTFDKKMIDDKMLFESIIDTLHMKRYSPEGVELKQMINLWMNNLITYEATNASLQMLDNHRDLLDSKFEQYVPIGASIKKMEREIFIREQEYLSLLESLSVSELRQQDISMSSASLQVVDAPLFPISTEPNKKNILAILAFIATSALILSLIVMLELTDKTLRDAFRAARITGYEVIGLLPIAKYLNKKQTDEITRIASEQLFAFILKIRDTQSNPIYINVLSMEKLEGKSYVSNILFRKFKYYDYTVRSLNHDYDFDVYSKVYCEAQTPAELDTKGLLSDVYITELPSLVSHVAPNSLIQKATLNIMVCRANRAWHQVDIHTSKLISDLSNTPLYIILNGVENNNIDSFIGEIPKNRSKFRRIIKRFALREYSSSGTLK